MSLLNAHVVTFSQLTPRSPPIRRLKVSSALSIHVPSCYKKTCLVKDSWKLYYFLPVMCSGECDTRSRFTEYAVGKISVLEVQKEVLCWTEPVDIYLLRSNQWQFYTLYLLAPLHISSPLNTMTLILLSCITLWTSLFVELTVSFWAWCHCRVVSQEGSSYLALPFPYHHVAPASPRYPFLSLSIS